MCFRNANEINEPRTSKNVLLMCYRGGISCNSVKHKMLKMSVFMRVLTLRETACNTTFENSNLVTSTIAALYSAVNFCLKMTYLYISLRCSPCIVWGEPVCSHRKENQLENNRNSGRALWAFNPSGRSCLRNGVCSVSKWRRKNVFAKSGIRARHDVQRAEQALLRRKVRWLRWLNARRF